MTHAAGFPTSSSESSPAQSLRAAFSAPMDADIAAFVASVETDRRLLDADLRGSLAHVAMLEACGVLTSDQAARLRTGLERIRAEGLTLDPAYEDVHMNVERRLEELIGEDAHLLHTARSRNDQVALDLRLYVRDCETKLRAALGELTVALVDKAEACADVVMPGYTHLQRAQPVSFAHVLLAYHAALMRDAQRLRQPLISPLGAGALAGTAVPIDPFLTARLLNADGLFSNALDAVMDRDFAVAFVFACTLLAVHLSQLAETLILWCSQEFNFIRLPDELTTGSSLMPQKKNPDCLELVRGRAGQCIGELVNLLTTLKGLPVGYNRDLQETKPPVARVAETVAASVKVCTLAVQRLTVNREIMRQAASDERLYATDLVEKLVAQGVPFRTAYTMIGNVVRHGVPFSQVSADEWAALGLSVTPETFTPEQSIAGRASHGGTSPARIADQIAAARAAHREDAP
ncbi:MAG: argininosuccinate lyase [Chloracidobacterium sp.]|nr:argininosuccinate lyase [Chloracidobacterium sp.]MDW8218629.1 argininosuccinate lyase [Acidobacteriota bacterium]